MSRLARAHLCGMAPYCEVGHVDQLTGSPSPYVALHACYVCMQLAFTCPDAHDMLLGMAPPMAITGLRLQGT